MTWKHRMCWNKMAICTFSLSACSSLTPDWAKTWLCALEVKKKKRVKKQLSRYSCGGRSWQPILISLQSLQGLNSSWIVSCMLLEITGWVGPSIHGIQGRMCGQITWASLSLTSMNCCPRTQWPSARLQRWERPTGMRENYALVGTHRKKMKQSLE